MDVFIIHTAYGESQGGKNGLPGKSSPLDAGKYQPLTPPAVRPLVRFFSMAMNRMTTGMVA